MKTAKAGRTVLIIATVLALLTLAACVHRPKEETKPTKTKADIEAERAPDVLSDPQVGDIVLEKVAPVTGARVYEEMQQGYYEGGSPLSRVIVEYKGKKVQMLHPSGVLSISPDGRYVLYAHAAWGYNHAIYLYDVIKEKTQQLTPSDVEQGTERERPDYISTPGGSSEVIWMDSKISYIGHDGKAWTLTFKKE